MPNARTSWGLGLCAAVIVGSLGPWASWGAFTVNGTTRDGKYTLALAIFAAVVVFTERARLLVGVVALLLVAGGVADTADVNRFSYAGLPVSVSWGLILVDVASVGLVLWSIGAIAARRSEKRIEKTAEPEPAAAGWYTNPNDASELRWWDGVGWTDTTKEAPLPPPTGAPHAS